MTKRVIRKYVVLDVDNKAYMTMEREYGGTAEVQYCSICGEPIRRVYIRIRFQSTPNSEVEYLVHTGCLKNLVSDLI